MIIHARAPHNVLAVGSWTDLAFAEHGAVFTCAGNGGVDVVISSAPHPGCALHHTREDYVTELFLRQAQRYFGTDHLWFHLRDHGVHGMTYAVPPALAVAVVGALAYLSGKTYTPPQVAQVAHGILRDILPTDSWGVHPMLSAALGGVSLLRISPYPRALVSPLLYPDTALHAFEERVVVVPISRLTRHDWPTRLARRYHAGDRQVQQLLWCLRGIPERAAKAFCYQEYDQLAEALVEYAQLQRHLCPEVMSPEVRHISTVAQQHGAQAVMVQAMGNQACVFCPPDRQQHIIVLLQQMGYLAFPLQIVRSGLQVWPHEPPAAAPPLFRNPYSHENRTSTPDGVLV